MNLTDGRITLQQKQPWSWIHCRNKRECLECKLPFHLHAFHGLIKCKPLREAWLKAVRWEPFDKKTLATSCKWSSLFHSFYLWTGNWWKCQINPFLGYESKKIKSRKTLFRKPLKKVKEGDITPATWSSQ